ncbi:MAG: SurA N-terminal domain-containing protein [Deltaproteobacteria bacterium]|nr:SurA N-terminal domain-containing protein [Deltaproteobacteria bacterium]
MKHKRLKMFVILPTLLLVILATGVYGFQRHYSRQLWDPQTAALVNGEPLPRSAIEEVIVSGYHLRQDSREGGSAGQESIRQILDRLIDEELVGQAARKAGVRIAEAEVEEQLEAYRKSFGCRGDDRRAVCQPAKSPSGVSLARAVEKQLLYRAMGRLVFQKEARPSGGRWRTFWRAYLAGHYLAAAYKARVLLVEDLDDPAKYLTVNRKVRDLETMAEAARAAGLTVRVTEPMSIDLKAPATLEMFRSAGLREQFVKAMSGDIKLTDPVRLSDSWAVFEVLGPVNPPTPEQLAAAGRAAYEREVGEEAFRTWLAGLRAEAVIVVNPNLLESAEEGGLADVFSPRVPWAEGLGWDIPSDGGAGDPGRPGDDAPSSQSGGRDWHVPPAGPAPRPMEN